MPDDKDDGLLTRWSQRKRAVAEEEIAPEPDVDALALAEAEKEAELAANREAAEAVDLESLDKDSDFSIFLKEGVPDLLKRQALTRLWRSSPVLANIDGLNDYDEDFGRPELLMKTFKSAWQAGRGYLEHAEKEEAGPAAVDGEEVAGDRVDEIAMEEEADLAEEEAAVQAGVKSDEEDLRAEAGQAGVSEIADEEMEVVQRVSLRRRLMLEDEE